MLAFIDYGVATTEEGEIVPGILIAFEGLDWAGKTTQVEALRKRLEGRAYEVILTSNNTSTFLREPISRMRERLSKGDPIDLVTNILLNATDLSDRLCNLVRPALDQGSIVLADRYVYSYIAQTVVRGADRDWVEAVFSFATQPELTFLVDTPAELCLERKRAKNRGYNPWESGVGLGLSEDPYESFLLFQSKCLLEFRRLAKKWNSVVLDGSACVDELECQIWSRVSMLLENGVVDG
jgi:dTMP kinase